MPSLFSSLIKRIISLILTLFIITAVLYATVMFTPAETRATLFLPKEISAHITDEQYQNHIEKIIEKYLPGVTTNPMVNMVKGMTLKMILAMPQAAQLGLTKEKVEKILLEINKKIK